MRCVILTCALGLTSWACQKAPEARPPSPESGAEKADAPPAGSPVATARAPGESGVAGELRFHEAAGGVRVQGTIKRLAPGSTHGFHIPEKGDCSAADGSSAGGHFNPQKHEHGTPGPMSHVGDLGNITAGA